MNKSSEASSSSALSLTKSVRMRCYVTLFLTLCKVQARRDLNHALVSSMFLDVVLVHTPQERIRVYELPPALLLILLVVLLALLVLPPLLGHQLSPRLDQVKLAQRRHFQSGIRKYASRSVMTIGYCDKFRIVARLRDSASWLPLVAGRVHAT